MSAAASILRRLGLRGRSLVIAVPYLWMVLFFLIPFLIVLRISFSEMELRIPPYSDVAAWGSDQVLQIRLNIGNYLFLFSDWLYVSAYLNSIKIALVSTILCLLIGYPMAYGIARSDRKWRNLLLMLIVLPFWTSFLIRVYAWMGILNDNGLLNNFLIWLGIIDAPLRLIKTDFAVYLGIVYSYLPFMILPLYANLEKMDVSLIEAAMDLGARPMKTFFAVTLPLSVPGIVAGSLLVFIPAVGEFVIPELLGGPNTLMMGKVLYDEFFLNRDWPLASAVAITLLLLLIVPIMFFQRMQARQAEAGR